MTAEEFAATEKAAEAGYPLRLVPFLVPWVADGLPADVTARSSHDAGAAYSLVLRLFRPRFTRSDARTFRYA